MPTTLLTFPGDEIKMKWKEPYVTEGLNKKFAVNTPAGIYRGFKLSEDPTAGDRTVQVTADTTFLDHVAVIETVTGFSLTLRRSSGNFILDLSSYSSQTVVVSIFGSYAVGSTTSAIIRAYTTAEYAALSSSAKLELVVLGSVIVPASGAIPVASISRQLTKFAWSQQAAGALPWKSLLRNGTFEYGTTSDSTARFTPFWDAETTGHTIDWTLQTGGAENSAYRLNAYENTGGTATGEISQNVWMTVKPRQLLKLRFFKKCLTALTSGGPPQVVIEHTAGTKTINIACAATDADWVEVTDQFELSATATVLIKRVYITPNSSVFTVNNVFSISNIQLWIQTEAVSSPDWQDERISDEIARRVMLTAIQTPTSTPWLDKAAVLEFDSTLGYSAQGRVSLLNRDGDAAVASPQLNAPGGIVSNVGTGPSTEAVQGQIDNVSGYAVKGTNTSGTAIYGESAATRGLSGKATSFSGVGVHGESDNATPGANGVGVEGTSNCTGGYGIKGTVTGSGATGVYGHSDQYIGLSGYSDDYMGVKGMTAGASGVGVFGNNPSGANGVGVEGMASGTSGIGVKGTAASGTGVVAQGNGVGVDAKSDAIALTAEAPSFGVLAVATGALLAIGVSGTADGDTSVGVAGSSDGTDSVGVSGTVTGLRGVGIRGSSGANGVGVEGNSFEHNAKYYAVLSVPIVNAQTEDPATWSFSSLAWGTSGGGNQTLRFVFADYPCNSRLESIAINYTSGASAMPLTVAKVSASFTGCDPLAGAADSAVYLFSSAQTIPAGGTNAWAYFNPDQNQSFVRTQNTSGSNYTSDDLVIDIESTAGSQRIFRIYLSFSFYSVSSWRSSFILTKTPT